MTSAEVYPCDVINPALLSSTTPTFFPRLEDTFSADIWLLDNNLSGNHEQLSSQKETTSVLSNDPSSHGQSNAVSFHPETAWSGAQILPDIQIDAPESKPESITKGLTRSRKRTRKRREDRKFQRQAIPGDTKALLTTYFEHNPYPSPAEYAKLVTQHALPLKTIKNWFSNTRARKDPNRKQSSASRPENIVFILRQEEKRLTGRMLP